MSIGTSTQKCSNTNIIRLLVATILVNLNFATYTVILTLRFLLFFCRQSMLVKKRSRGTRLPRPDIAWMSGCWLLYFIGSLSIYLEIWLIAGAGATCTLLISDENDEDDTCRNVVCCKKRYMDSLSSCVFENKKGEIVVWMIGLVPTAYEVSCFFRSL